MKRTFALLTGLSLVLSACGESRIERAGSGAAIGGGIGLAGGYLCCGQPGDAGATGLFGGMIVGAIIGLILDEPLFFNYHK